MFVAQPGPVGKEQAPVHASSGHGGVPSHSDDDEAEDAQEVVAPEGAAAAQAPADVPPATSAPSLNQGEIPSLGSSSIRAQQH